ncbi:MAG: tRNA (adenosine(37)-N6)-dimethylallyltransferase MiaA [Chloroflexota bacterium]
MTGAPSLLVIAGATATGKSGLAIRTALALRADGIPAEIVSADSRQVFSGLDIGTAKVTVLEREGVPHHGLNLVDPDQPFSLADFSEHVGTVLPRIAGAGGVAILVGGTGLYLRAIAAGIDTDALPSDAVIRAGLEAEMLAGGLGPLAERLRAVAPIRAARIDLQNPRRVVRALEIAMIDGGVGPLPPRRGYRGPMAWIGLIPDDRHEDWIRTRAQAQFDEGLLDEAAALRRRFDPALPAFSAISYREAWDVLAGTIAIDAAVASVTQRSVAFAKRQRTWFRSERGIEWLGATDPGLDARVLAVARTLQG